MEGNKAMRTYFFFFFQTGSVSMMDMPGLEFLM